MEQGKVQHIDEFSKAQSRPCDTAYLPDNDKRTYT